MENLKTATTFDPVAQISSWDDKPAEAYKKNMDEMSDRRKNLMNEDDYYYELSLKNVGGLPMPVLLEFVYADDSKEMIRIPAELWKLQDEVSKVFITDQPVKQIILDPKKETADVDKTNNYWPKDVLPAVFESKAKR